MGQRGYRKRRLRCQFVDPRSGLRCRVQVKWAGCKFCSQVHANAAKCGLTPPAAASGARARHLQARENARQRITDALQMMPDDQGRVPLLTAVQIAIEARDEGYARGYSAGHEKGRDQARTLRLETSRLAVNEFLATRFGKGFILGNLRAEDLANFSFGGSR